MIRLTVTVDGKRYFGGVERVPQGWARMLYGDQRHPHVTYFSGTEGRGVTDTAAQAVEELIVDIGRIWGVDTDRPWYWEVEE